MEHRQAVTFGGNDGIRARWLCWVECGQKRAGGELWYGRDRRTPEQGCSLVTCRGGERHGRIGRCASAAMNGDGMEVLRENRSRWKGGGSAELLCRVGKGRNEVGSWRVYRQMPTPNEYGLFATRRVRGARRLPIQYSDCCFYLWMGLLPVSDVPLPKL